MGRSTEKILRDREKEFERERERERKMYNWRETS